MTEGEVAKRAKVSLLWVQRLEANQLGKNYRLLHLFWVFAVFGLTPYELYKRVGEMTGPPLWLEKERRRIDEKDTTGRADPG